MESGVGRVSLSLSNLFLFNKNLQVTFLNSLEKESNIYIHICIKIYRLLVKDFLKN